MFAAVTQVTALMATLEPLSAGLSLCGAGGGGFLIGVSAGAVVCRVDRSAHKTRCRRLLEALCRSMRVWLWIFHLLSIVVLL